MSKFGRQFINQHIEDRGAIHEELVRLVREHHPGVGDFAVSCFYVETTKEGEWIVVEAAIPSPDDYPTEFRVPASALVRD